MSTDLTCITNEAGKTLRHRFEDLLRGHTRFFDSLVGYFYVSGFPRIYRSLESAERVRILIGLSTDRATYDLLQQAGQAELDLASHAQAKESLPPAILRELEKADDSIDVENGIRTFIEWVRTGKLEVRVYPSEKIHAKVYIMTFVDGHMDAGRVITGSSNFSQAGLQDNLEFNVELKNRSDYEFALAKFNALWANGVDVATTYVETIERKSPYAQFTPYELYLKLLYEYFRGELNRPEELEDVYRPSDDFRILGTTDVLAEGVNLHRSAIVINYDIPWNPTRLMQRVGRINRVDTPFDTIRVYNFFPTDEGDDIIKLKDAAAAKIHAFIEMLGSDARLLTDGEEIKAYELFGRLNSKRTITGEDEEEDSDLEYLTEVRRVRDQQPDLFERIKHLPKKARSTRTVDEASRLVPTGETKRDASPTFPALLTYFRQHRLDKFFLCQSDAGVPPAELDFLTAARTIRPADKAAPRQPIPPAFYGLLDRNKHAFVDATSEETTLADTRRAGRNNETYILQRLRAKEIHHCKTYTEDDEEFIRQVLSLLDQGALPRPTTKKVAEALRKEIEPLKVLAILRRDIPIEFLRTGHLRQDSDPHKPREVILSSWITEPKGIASDGTA